VGNQVQLTLNSSTTIVATDNPNRLYPMFANSSAISPDGWTLIYMTADSVGLHNTTFTAVNLKTLGKQVIASLGDSWWSMDPKWSPDGKHILYVRQDTQLGLQLWVMDPTGAHQRPMISGSPLTAQSLVGFQPLMPQWSADGKSLIFYDNAYKPTTTQYTLNLATGKLSSAPAPALCMAGGGALPMCGGGGGIRYTPVYLQSDSRWGGIVMQNWGGTIANDGCALTDLTMLFDYNGSTVGDPGGMAGCLNPRSYAEPLAWYGAQVNPPNGPGCDRFTTNFINKVSYSWSTIDTYLRDGWPVIAGGCWDAPTCNQTHWVLIVGGNGSDNTAYYWDNNPAYGDTEQMNNAHLNGWTPEWIVLYQKASGTGSPCE
jgi:hypothetical protein